MFILCIPARFPDTPGGPLQRAGKDPVLGREECKAPRAPRPQEVQAEVPRHHDLEGLSRALPGRLLEVVPGVQAGLLGPGELD